MHSLTLTPTGGCLQIPAQSVQHSIVGSEMVWVPTGSSQDLEGYWACRGWLENVGQFVDGKFWDDGQAYQFQYEVQTALGVRHMSAGTFRLKTDQHAVSEHLPPWPHTSKYRPKMILTNASEQELGSDHGGESTILSRQSAHSLNRPLPNWVCGWLKKSKVDYRKHHLCLSPPLFSLFFSPSLPLCLPSSLSSFLSASLPSFLFLFSW